ncbi:hypothetical protein HMI49_01430 [Corallococcus exercitus]|uniref:Uncharacterized protein n=1 Tax=Corallococcus exercitus TaxID=2316736 RepID=A0A7Y4KDJ6_9BACT|nr:hypothetical protein [Corallococcus exercitus]NOK31863.1 hypothetical protein [Corallococcus exercitus]
MDLTRGFRGLLAWGLVMLTGCAAANYEGVGRRCPSCTVEPMPASLPPGTFVEYRVDTSLLKNLRVTFTVLRETTSERWVEARMRRRARLEKRWKALYERPLVFVMKRQPLSGEMQNHPIDTRVSTDEPRPRDAGWNYRARTSSPMKLEVNGKTFECQEYAYYIRPGDEARGCVQAKDPRILFAGGAFFLEEHFMAKEEPSLRIKLLNMGQRPVQPANGIIALRSTQSAVYEQADGARVTHRWTTGDSRVRHVHQVESHLAPPLSRYYEWEGTLLEVMIALAEESESPYSPQPDSDAREDLQAGNTLVRVFQRRLHGQDGGDTSFELTSTYAEDPWQLEDAPIWIRHRPLEEQGTYGGAPVHYWLKDWK